MEGRLQVSTERAAAGIAPGPADDARRRPACGSAAAGARATAGDGAAPRLRILFLIRDMSIGGAQRQLAMLARGLVALGHEVTVVTFYPGGDLQEELAASGARSLCLDKRGRWDMLRFFRRFLGVCRTVRPDIVHGYMDGPNLVALTAKLALPGARIFWGVRSSNMDAGLDRFEAALVPLQARLSGVPAAIISNSHSGKRYLIEKGFDGAKIAVVPNGIDTDRFRPQPELGAALRREWGIAPEAVLIGMVARLDRKKDHPAFLRAAAALRAEDPSLRFVCVGGGPADYRAQLTALAARLGLSDSLLWAGERRDMAAVYNALDLLCLPSAYGEGFPNVLGEAMACGVPCVGSGSGDAAWIIGDTGAVARSTEPGPLADALRRVAREARRPERRDACRRRIVEEFSVATLVERSLAVLGPQ